MNLSEKVVVITGAKGGLGTFVTDAFLKAGARVFGVSRSISANDFPGVAFTAVQAEITSGEDIRMLLDSITAEAGRIDGLVHLVGGFAGGQSVADTDDATLENMLHMNLRTAFYLIRGVLPQMRAQGGGRILALGSKAAMEPAPMAGAYAASKAALVSLIRTVARENIDKNITASILLPATMNTPANRKADPAADPSKWVDPNQVAQMLVHLMSGASSQISGAVIPVYGVEA